MFERHKRGERPQRARVEVAPQRAKPSFEEDKENSPEAKGRLTIHQPPPYVPRLPLDSSQSHWQVMLGTPLAVLRHAPWP